MWTTSRSSLHKTIKGALHLKCRVFHTVFKTVDNLFRTLLLIVFPAFLFGQSVIARELPGKKYSRSEYISLWKDVAIREMAEHGIPASITLAQAILESGDGNSELARKANNHFGIKCHDWDGKKSYHDDDLKGECFRKYKSAAESFSDHSIFLQRKRYAFLFDYEITDYKAWAKGLKKAGYATNPKYPQLLIRLIEENDLHKYDLEGLKKGKSKNRKSESKSPEEDEIVIEIERGLEIFRSDNRIKYIVLDDNYTPDEIAEKMDMGAWQVRKYNDVDRGQDLQEGMRLYLQPKRNKSRTVETHVVKKGENLWEISQKYGVKMKKILKRSDLPKDYNIKPGDTLRLR